MKFNPPIRRRLVIATVLLALFSITGFLIAPPILRAQLETRLSTELGRRVTVEKVKLNPYALSLTLESFAIQEPDGTTRFLGWDRLYVNFDAWSSLWGEWVLSEIALDGFNAGVGINADESYNFSDLLAKFAPADGAPAKPTAPARPVRIASLKVGRAEVAFSDASRAEPFATTLGPVTFSLTEFRTVSQRGAPYRFEAATEADEKLAWTGTLQAEPLRSVGELSIENIVLAKYAPYYADQIQADLVAGTLSLSGAYEVNLAADQRRLQWKHGAVQVRDLKLVERATKEPALELPEVSVTGVEADAVALKATIAAVVLAGGNVRLRRDADGAINLLTMLRPPEQGSPAAATMVAAAPARPTPVALATTAVPGPTATVPATAPAQLPDVTIAKLTANAFRIDMSDLAAPRPTELALNDIRFSMRDVTLAEGAQMPLQLAFAWAPKGTVRLEGTMAIAPVTANMKVEVADFELLPLSPYLEQFADARLTGGAVTATLEMHVSVPDSNPLVASVSGDIQVNKLGLIDGAQQEELAGFGGLALRGLRASTAPELSIAFDEINLAAPFARVIVNADKSLNLASVLRIEPPAATGEVPVLVGSGESAPVATGAPPEGPPSLQIDIGKIVISDGDYRFADRSIEPNVRMGISGFGGTIAGLSSSKRAKGEVDLKALVDGAGPITIAGTFDPLATKTAADLKIAFKNVDLLPLSPYSGKFAGYELARGKLLVDVKLLVDGATIDSANVITLNQFTFGNPVKSPDATSLPVRLGVALLKDSEGKIVIDVPIRGKLDDPSFSVGPMVSRVITNLLTKAASSPFTLLGAAFGGGGEELAFQEFAPGSSDIQAAEMKKLETMIQALTNRPGLSLGLAASYDAAADTYALKRVKLAEQVRRAVWEKKQQGDPNTPPPTDFVVSAEENVAMIKKLYDEKFPPGTEFGAAVPPPPAVVTPPPPPAGIFQRLTRAITRQAVREQRLAEQENARLAAEHAQAVEAAVAAGLPFEEMNARLAEAITIDDDDLRALAKARAQRVRDYFASVGGIAAERMFLAQETSDAAVATAAAKGPRVFLSLE